MVALAGCATLKNKDNWDTGSEVGGFVAVVPARFTVTPQPVVHDGQAVERTASVVPAAVESPAATASATGFVTRSAVVFAHHVVAGVEFEGGAVRSGAVDAVTTGDAVLLGASAMVGLRQRIGTVTVGAELVAGIRKLERHTDDGTLFYAQGDGFVEPRLTAQAWLLSWLSLGAEVALARDGITGAGIRIGFSIPRSQR